MSTTIIDYMIDKRANVNESIMNVTYSSTLKSYDPCKLEKTITFDLLKTSRKTMKHLSAFHKLDDVNEETRKGKKYQVLTTNNFQ